MVTKKYVPNFLSPILSSLVMESMSLVHELRRRHDWDWYFELYFEVRDKLSYPVLHTELLLYYCFPLVTVAKKMNDYWNY